MIYTNFQDLQLSQLAFGAMRLPTTDGTDEHVDDAQVQQMVDYAFAHGVNYFDTAYGYHNGQSEVSLGQALQKYSRERFFLADKFPGYDLNNMDKVEEIFQEQLKRCGVDYFDFYLFHNVYEKNLAPYMDPQYGIMDYLRRQKAEGRIRHLGFSAHGSIDVVRAFLEQYGAEMEFCQLQINYLDWDFQDAKEKAALVSERNIPIWVMEPLRGGKLCKLSEADMAKLEALRPGQTATEWAFRFLQGIPGVTTILSGMSNLQQVEQNIAVFETPKPLSSQERDTLLSIARDMVSAGILPCTACRYCVPHCPKGLDIPALLALYNEHSFTGGGFIAPMAVDAMPENKRPSACIACRSCEAVCPQQLKISEALSSFDHMLHQES